MDEYTKHVQSCPRLKKLAKPKELQVGEVQKSVKKLKLESDKDELPGEEPKPEEPKAKVRTSKSPRPDKIKPPVLVHSDLKDPDLDKDLKDSKERALKNQHSLFKFFGKQEARPAAPTREQSTPKKSDILS